MTGIAIITISPATSVLVCTTPKMLILGNQDTHAATTRSLRNHGDPIGVKSVHIPNYPISPSIFEDFD